MGPAKKMQAQDPLEEVDLGDGTVILQTNSLQTSFISTRYAKRQVLQTNNLQNVFYFPRWSSGRFCKRTTCKPFLFLSCAKWKILQTNSCHLPFSPSVIPGVSGQEMSLINHFKWQVLQTNSLQQPIIFS